MENPALKLFVSQIEKELVLAQVLISRKNEGFELRHVEDRLGENVKLHLVALSEVRALAQFTADGSFRPLKSAPNLKTGWRFVAANAHELSFALDQLYPNALADWFAVQSGQPPITSYREFTHRQTGMYRVTTLLNDAQAGQMIRACCDAKFCLKQRLWTVEGLAPDLAEAKSRVPCLEPCAILLEFARKALRMEQEEKVNFTFSPSDAASVEAALEIALRRPRPELREADFNAPANPRRLQLALEKLRASGIPLAKDSPED